MKRITFEGHFCDICQCIGEPGNTSECPGGYCDQRRTWERLKEYEDKIERGELAEVVRCKDCKHFVQSEPYDPCECMKWTIKWGVAYTQPDGFCFYGERRTDGETERT